jgi:hypothetical protein
MMANTGLSGLDALFCVEVSVVEMYIELETSSYPVLTESDDDFLMET